MSITYPLTWCSPLLMPQPLQLGIIFISAFILHHLASGHFLRERLVNYQAITAVNLFNLLEHKELTPVYPGLTYHKKVTVFKLHPVVSASLHNQSEMWKVKGSPVGLGRGSAEANHSCDY